MKAVSGNPDKAILIKDSAVVKDNLSFYYGDNYVCYGIPDNAKAKEIKIILEDIKQVLEPVKVILVADSNIIKCLTKEKVSDGVCVHTSLGATFQIPNYNSIIYNIANKPRLDFCMDKVNEYLNTGCNSAIGSDVLKNPTYQINDICFDELYKHPVLTVDIETSGLKFHTDYIISIAFSWDKHSGIAMYINNDKTKIEQLAEFFRKYEGKLIFHNATFDTMFIIRYCYMNDIQDWKGMLTGLDIMFRDTDDTRIIAYLSLNSCSRTSYKLKQLAYEYTGEYAQEDIDDASHIPVDRLLPYNLTDTCATWYVYDKYYPIMKADNQENIYLTLLKPSLKVLVQTQMVGMRIDPSKLNDLESDLFVKEVEFEKSLRTHDKIKEFEYQCKLQKVAKYNLSVKTKRKSVKDYEKEWCFNFASNQQLSTFLYEFLHLPILSYTKKGNPAVDADTIMELQYVKEAEPYKDLLKVFYEYSKLRKIITSFLGEFKESPKVGNCLGLYGNFNLCGTISGRLSSSKPNLQQLPSTGSPYAKPIKNIFIAPEGYIFVGADQRSLEDRISALTTKDSQKLKVYIEGFDSHALRAYSYFREQMPDITKELEEHPENELEIINSIKTKHKDLRQASKGVTFCLTYGGTKHALMSECGLTEDQAIQAESRYHELYKESDAWVKERIDKAKETGYVECAFGLRLRTPLLKNSITSGYGALKEASKEGRTAGNALGQSWCLLNSRSTNEVMEKVWNSKYRYDILPVAQIHDASYFFIKDDIDVLIWFNKVLIKAMEWQEDPAIAHDTVKLGGDLELFIPDWAHGTEIPNNATKEQIIEVINENKK